MSNYFRVLDRLNNALRKEAPPEARLTEVPPPALHVPAAPITPVAAPLAVQSLACSRLLDCVRALTIDSAVPRVALAAVSEIESLDLVIAGLVSQAEEQGLSLFVAQFDVLSDRRRAIVPYRTAPSGAHPLAPLDLGTIRDSGRDSGEIRAWLDTAAEGHQMVLIRTAPVANSVEGAQIARSCDGIVLVAEPLKTRRKDLLAAVERARSADLTILGLVLVGAEQHLPNWLERLFDRMSG